MKDQRYICLILKDYMSDSGHLKQEIYISDSGHLKQGLEGSEMMHLGKLQTQG